MFDRDSSGFITQREFKEATRQLGLPLTFTQVHALMERFVHFSDANKVSYREFLDGVATRQRLASSRQATRLLMGATKPLSVEGSGYDGLSMNGNASLEIARGRVDDRGFGANETGTGDFSRFDANHMGPPPRTIEKWLNESASRDEREKFADVYDSISRYDREENQRQAPWYNGDEKQVQSDGSALVDHRNNQIVRIVSHIPYDIANSSTWNDRTQSKHRRSLRWEDDDYESRGRQERRDLSDDRDRDWDRMGSRDRFDRDSRDRFDSDDRDRFDRNKRDRRDSDGRDRIGRESRDRRDRDDRDRFDRDGRDKFDRGFDRKDRDRRDRNDRDRFGRDSQDRRRRESTDRYDRDDLHNRDRRDRDRDNRRRGDEQERDQDRYDRYDSDRDRYRDRDRDRRRSERGSQW